MNPDWQLPDGERQTIEQALGAKFGYRNLRYHSTDIEKQVIEKRAEQSWQHSRPWSVFVAAIGYHWSPGSYQRVVDMVDFSNRHGIYVTMEEIMDRCKEPFDALGAMRNEALMRARQGYEWLLYVDNDVLPEQDALLKLLRWDMPITAPFIIEPGTNKPLHGPFRTLGSGLQPVRWCVLSMLLFRTSVFTPWAGGEFWNNAIGADEGYHFQKLWDVGHRPMLDTTFSVPVFKPPLYPLAANRMEEGQAKSFWDKRRQWLLEIPDRHPVNPDDPRQADGDYIPALPVSKQNSSLTRGNVPQGAIWI